jgi:hypothetical protein
VGYTTNFEGAFEITPTLAPEHAAYLRAFSETRRMKRDASKVAQYDDDSRRLVGLPIGNAGEYFVGERYDCGQRHTPDIIDYNEPPATQPGLWCQWIPNAGGTALEWDGGEKFDYYVQWLNYLIKHFFTPWGYSLSGVVTYEGEDGADFGKIEIVEGRAVKRAGKRVW